MLQRGDAQTNNMVDVDNYHDCSYCMTVVFFLNFNFS